MALDRHRVEAFVAGVAADQAAAMHLATVVLGEKLGLYRALAGAGPQTPQQLAERTGYEPRLVKEWLRAQAVSGYCAYDSDTGVYWLTPEQQACLVDDDSPTYVAGGLVSVSAVHRRIDQVADVFRRGGTLPWGDHDPALFVGVARGFRPAYATHLVPSWIPALAGVEQRLRDGGSFADLACGYGTTTILLAQAFPAATAVGFDSHDGSVEAARQAAADAGVAGRVTFEVADATELPGDGYDLVCAFNALHEMGDPVTVCTRIRAALTDGGVLMVVEPKAGDTDEQSRNPVGRNFTSVSTMVCLPSALSQGGTWHLGAQAPDSEFEAVATEAGFSSCRRVAETQLHRVLEITG